MRVKNSNFGNKSSDERDATTHSITVKFNDPFEDHRLEWANLKRKSLECKLTKGKTKKTINGVFR